MMESYSFRPPQRRGMMFHIVIVVALSITSAFSLFYGLNQPSGGYAVLLLLLSLLLFAPVPLVLYRAYALLRASYRLERDGLRLRWGLRAEDIPFAEIEWVRRSSEIPGDLPLPRLIWPGAITGVTSVPDLGKVEFMAATTQPLLLVATRERVYAISPADSEGFMRAYQQSLEMGSLGPFDSVSLQPAAYLSQVLNDRIARNLLGLGLVLTLILFVGIGVILPSRIASHPETGGQILILPILGAFAYLADLAAGLFFYRSDERRMIAYILWISGVSTALLLIIAAFIMA